MEVKVGINEEEEMLSIEANDKVLFYGNYWDFDRPESSIELLEGLGLEVQQYRLKNLG